MEYGNNIIIKFVYNYDIKSCLPSDWNMIVIDHLVIILIIIEIWPREQVEKIEHNIDITLIIIKNMTINSLKLKNKKRGEEKNV